MTSPLVIEKCGIDIVHGCQLRCVGCPNSTLLPKIKRIAIEDFGLILRNLDVRHINLLRLFNFGEPLLHRELPRLLELIPQQSWTVSTVEISTNAQFHDFDMLEEALRLKVVTRLAVSCDGDGTPEEYERLRPPSKWEKLIEFLEKVGELKKKYNLELELITRTICTDRQSQIRWSRILLPLGWTPEFRGWMYLPESKVNMVGRDPLVPDRPCSFVAPGNRLYVDWDGSVVPCCVHPRAGVFGDLKVQRYSEILSGQKREQFVRLMKEDRKRMRICNECEF
jgi:radical SAM protein with 4Fe4S-binding SPASM domain